ncbi:hypothetical protein ALC57_00777 [Trachymyrmex cornetzi]|uniref:Uncharacterized protein n=1 Tax=Trachymyrmex cornetzi TaxID=471704 RepID=A0A151JR02_9HYME|nr:hypothetical protein ALC57_00777 [Trachymyrmex cornetzi]
MSGREIRSQVCMRERNGRIAGTAGADEVLIAIIREVAALDGDTPVATTKLRAVHKVQNGSTSRGHPSRSPSPRARNIVKAHCIDTSSAFVDSQTSHAVRSVNNDSPTCLDHHVARL